jgi:diguanylate cyclase (GGDEF)-like protein
LKKLEEMYLDANPLTHLPGGIAIENVLKKRIKNRVAFAFCLVDLDHFKVFNDHYGYGTGNKVIITTSHIIEKSVELYGSKNDFVGHIGGDDFVIITSHQHYKKICQFVVKTFDDKIPQFYEKKDLKKGFIKAISRAGKQEKFPIMSISIAVVTNKKQKFRHHIQVSEVAAELKNYVKSYPYSLFLEDRRKTDGVHEPP